MALTAKNRKKVEALIYATLDKLEPSGMNTAKYKAIFKAMSDAQFVAYFKRIKEDENAHLYVENDLYGKNQITLGSIKAAANFINVPLEEYIYLKHKTEDGTEIRSAFKVPVMYIHLKRMQQLLSKKVRTNVDIDSGNVRSRVSGSLNSDNKSGRFTDADTQALISVTSETGWEDAKGDITHSPIVLELLGMRGDNAQARMKLSQSISLYAEPKMLEIFHSLTDGGKRAADAGQAVKSLDAFYLGAGLKVDVLTPSYLTKQGTKQ